MFTITLKDERERDLLVALLRREAENKRFVSQGMNQRNRRRHNADADTLEQIADHIEEA